ncbi:MAG: hypothetical protein WCJ30_21800, partial [Deltaproteobacteria bacterium]
LGAVLAPSTRARSSPCGHSAGGAFAYLVGYEQATGVAALFTLAAPHYAVTSLAEPTYRPPIHMYYGADDPNYTSGSAAANATMWTRFGIAWEQDLQTGYGHSTWPDGSMRAGFDFLLAHRYPGAPTPSLCATGTDSGPVGTDAASDALATQDVSAPADVVPPADAGRDARADGASDARTDGGTSGAVGGCGCSVPGGARRGSAGRLLASLAALGAVAARRRRPLDRAAR